MILLEQSNNANTTCSFESKSAVELSAALGIDVEGQATVLTESPTESPTEAPTESPTESPTDSPSAPTVHSSSLKIYMGRCYDADHNLMISL